MDQYVHENDEEYDQKLFKQVQNFHKIKEFTLTIKEKITND
jgi:hypothetical protein